MADRTLPGEISEYIGNWILDFHSPAFVFTDSDGKVRAKGGALSRFGMADLREGSLTTESAYFLEGLLPSTCERAILSRVQTMSGVFADIHLFRVPGGDCVLLLDASEDVAERTRIEQLLRDTEERLRHAEKMEALGRLAGGVAHDFNNILTVILGYSQLLIDDSISADIAREINAAAKRAAGMTRYLLSFSRRQVFNSENLNLGTLLKGLEQLLRRLIREDILLCIILDPDLEQIEADRGQMEQILINLAANASDAIQAAGQVEIRAANKMVDEAYLRNHPTSQLRYGPHVSLAVTDTGCGMDAQTMKRALEPYFTSKPTGQGTGLGLSIVYGIVAQSGGDINFTSDLGKGTTVEILLPAVQSAEGPVAPPGQTARSNGTETVLVVEDEDGVRSLIRRVLTSLGYTVLEHSDPLAALAWCELYDGAIDLLLTDLIMPRMDGGELAGSICRRRPDMRVLYVSGYPVESVAKRGVELNTTSFLAKPFTPEDLAQKVREALGKNKRDTSPPNVATSA